ncbi:hypothetical protein GCM10007235_19700 [Pseudoxanthomonas indica]|nr:hypothetical protein GCM10007235_19700 [Pseudoxanthomonas indica]
MPRTLPSLLLALLAWTFVATPADALAQTAYFFPNTQVDADPAVPTPEQFLGYPIGSRYTRHDELVAYFKELARTSGRVKLEQIGKTYEGRPLLLVTITDPATRAGWKRCARPMPRWPIPPARTAPPVAHRWWCGWPTACTAPRHRVPKPRCSPPGTWPPIAANRLAAGCASRWW